MLKITENLEIIENYWKFQITEYSVICIICNELKINWKISGPLKMKKKTVHWKENENENNILAGNIITYWDLD